MGGSPSTQYQIIQQLTQPTLDDAEPADIVGLDGNCAFKVAYKGEYWTPRGWQAADHLHPRDGGTLIAGDEGVLAAGRCVAGPGATSGVRPGGRTAHRPVWLDHAGDPIPDRDGLERSYMEEYEELGTVAFESEKYKRFVEVRDGLEQP